MFKKNQKKFDSYCFGEGKDLFLLISKTLSASFKYDETENQRLCNALIKMVEVRRAKKVDRTGYKTFFKALDNDLKVCDKILKQCFEKMLHKPGRIVAESRMLKVELFLKNLKCLVSDAQRISLRHLQPQWASSCFIMMQRVVRLLSAIFDKYCMFYPDNIQMPEKLTFSENFENTSKFFEQETILFDTMLTRFICLENFDKQELQLYKSLGIEKKQKQQITFVKKLKRESVCDVNDKIVYGCQNQTIKPIGHRGGETLPERFPYETPKPNFCPSAEEEQGETVVKTPEKQIQQTGKNTNQLASLENFQSGKQTGRDENTNETKSCKILSAKYNSIFL